MKKRVIGYAGTYTRESSKGIYRFVLDTVAGELRDVEVAAEIGSPTYITVRSDDRYLYSVAQNDADGGVAAYAIDPDTGALTYINEQLAAGAPPCHLAVDQGVVTTGNYHKGTVEYHTLETNGGLNQVTASIEHAGHGPHERQEKPHVHYAAHTPDGRYVVVADLGTDELITYQITADALKHVHTFQAKPGSGPRHITFHPNGQIAYLLTELSSEVIVLDYDAASGSFTEIETVQALPEDFTATNDASAIHMSSDGKFLYTGNRGHNSITTFAVQDTGKHLACIDHTPTGGEWPRDFVLDPSENFLIAANQHTGNLVLFARDQATGKLTQLDSEVAVPETVCVKFLHEK